MDYKRKVMRNQIIVVFASFIVIIGCGLLIGFQNLFKSLLFLLPVIILLPAGVYFIIMNTEGAKQFNLIALWFGFAFAVTSIIGMLMDGRAYPLNWIFVLLVAGIVWLIISLSVIIFTPMLSKVMRLFVRK